MRRMRLVPSVIALGCLVFAPPLAWAGQRGAHPTPPGHSPPPTHSNREVVQTTPVPFSQRIANNPALVSRLQPLLPSGMTLATASAGFKNQGQFIAALHVSHNLNIPFAQLKAEMTGADHDSLGQAIHDLQPRANVKAAVKAAEKQARADIKAARPQTTDTNDRDKDDR